MTTRASDLGFFSFAFLHDRLVLRRKSPCVKRTQEIRSLKSDNIAFRSIVAVLCLLFFSIPITCDNSESPARIGSPTQTSDDDTADPAGGSDDDSFHNEDDDGEDQFPEQPADCISLPGAPVIRYIDPPSDATNISIGSSIYVKFSESMNKATINDHFRVKLGETDIQGTYSWNQNNTLLRFVPRDELPDGKNINIFLSPSSGEDVTGERLAEGVDQSFQTVDLWVAVISTPEEAPPQYGGGIALGLDGNLFTNSVYSRESPFDTVFGIVLHQIDAQGNLVDYNYYTQVAPMFGQEYISTGRADSDESGKIYFAGSLMNGEMYANFWASVYSSNFDELANVDFEQSTQHTYDWGNAIGAVGDGRFFVGGSSVANEEDGRDFTLYECSESGSILRSKIFDGGGSQEDVISDLAISPQGSMFVVGTAKLDFDTDDTEMWLWKYSTSNFSEVWSKKIEIDQDVGYEPPIPVSLNSVDVGDDSKIVVCGNIEDHMGSDYIFVESYLDTGEFEWRYISATYSHANCGGVTIDNEGSVIVAGSMWEADYYGGWLIKLNSEGEQQWEVTYTNLPFGSDNPRVEEYNDVVVDRDGNIYAVGCGSVSRTTERGTIVVKFDREGYAVFE